MLLHLNAAYPILCMATKFHDQRRPKCHVLVVIVRLASSTIEFLVPRSESCLPRHTQSRTTLPAVTAQIRRRVVPRVLTRAHLAIMFDRAAFFILFVHLEDTRFFVDAVGSADTSR